MNVLVLGATSDIARALARQLAKAGDHYVLAARDVVALTGDAEDLRVRTQARVSTAVFDASKIETHSEFVRKVIDEVGLLDGVIVAFGYLGKQSDFVEAARIIEVNFTGAVSVLEVLAAHLEICGSGWVLGLSSVAGERGRQSNYFYGAAKGAFTIYLEGLAHRLAPRGVRVKIAKLGMVASKMTRGMALPRALVVTPEAAARGLYWLLRSPFQSAYIPWRWWPIMMLIRLLPAQIFNRTKL